MSGYVIIFIILAAITKRAQVPFSRWLPAAMAAPTPVSALVHSSTLVTAGVFLLVRFYPYLRLRGRFHKVLLIRGCVTMLMAGINALRECDLKKIIALSTLRQLGVIISRIGLGLPELAFFHLVTHAIFKALLFVCAGTLIHLYHHSQDLRGIGNLSAQMPLTMACINRANLALCAFPFMAAFYSKDLIIEMRIYGRRNIVVVIIIYVATGITASYSMRLTFSSLWSHRMRLPIQCVGDED